MASFVLVHGSWHGGWCFDAVKALLEAEGHEVIAPDLPGMGGDEAALRGVRNRSCWPATAAAGS
jgi:pimeloyl-ACP methyl ester carboxylesterase